MSGVEQMLAVVAMLLIGAGLRAMPKRDRLPVRVTRRETRRGPNGRRG